MKKHQRIAIMGAGSWGTALATAFCRAGSQPVLWDRNPLTATTIQNNHKNPTRFPDIKLDPCIQATSSLPEALQGTDLVALTVPVQQIRSVTQQFSALLSDKTLIITSKGFEQETGLLIQEVIAQTIPTSPTVVLGGPNLAQEVVKGLPSSIAIASQESALQKLICDALNSPFMRPHPSHDPIGVQVAGAFKNVIAIACGMAWGRGWGENARSTFITQGFGEMVAFGKSLGAQPETFMGPAGIGDLFLTCYSPSSRNTAFGITLGEGAPPPCTKNKPVIEGAFTASAIFKRWNKAPQTLPLVHAVAQILCNQWKIDDALHWVLACAPKEQIITPAIPQHKKHPG